MLSGSAILRVVLLLVAVAGLAGLARVYWSHDGGLPETPLPSSPSAPAPAPPETSGTPRAGTAPQQAPPQEPVPAPSPAVPPTAAPVAAPPESAQRAEPAPAPAAPEPPPPPSPEAPVAAAEENAGPRAVDLVDLNAASLAELNRLKGGGAIGRAIIQHRPYSSVDQLLSKRVLSRAIFQRIKDQVTVR